MLAEHACIEHKELAISYVIMYSTITLLFLFCPGLFSSQIWNTANYIPLVSPCGSCSCSIFPIQAHFSSRVDFLFLGQLSIFARSLAQGESDLGRCPTPKIKGPCAHGITHATFSLSIRLLEGDISAFCRANEGKCFACTLEETHCIFACMYMYLLSTLLHEGGGGGRC